MPDMNAKALGLLYHPFEISVHVTDLCNSKCVFCSESSHEHVYDLVQKADILTFLRANDTQKWTSLNIHGGEPTISPFLLEIISCARTQGFGWIILQTNGRRIGMDEEFAIALDQSGVDLYNIGFHGSRNDIMDQLTGVNGSFDQALRGIRRISAFGKPIRITVVINRMNYKDITAIVLLAVKEKIIHINISAMQTGGSAIGNLEMLMVSYADAKPYIEEAVKIAESFGIKVTFEGFPYCVLKGMEKYQINWAEQHLKILYRKMIIENYNTFLTDTLRTYPPQCEKCVKRSVCSGVYKEYINKNGWAEFHSYQ